MGNNLTGLNGMPEMNEVKENISQNWNWVESEQARKMFGVCAKTWQTWRDRRVIPFSQFGRKIFYNLNDLNEFLRSRQIKAAN